MREREGGEEGAGKKGMKGGEGKKENFACKHFLVPNEVVPCISPISQLSTKDIMYVA